MRQTNPLAGGMSVEFYPGFSELEATPTVNDRDAASEAVFGQLAEARSSFVFTPDFMAAHGLGDYLLRSSRFTEREDWAQGRQASEQEVFFGELELDIDNGDTATVPVAAKPFTLFARDRAVHEFAAMEHFREHHALHPFTPVGFWVGEYGEPVLLTRFEEPVKSLDNVDWARTGEDPLREHYDLFTALQLSSQTLAHLHLEGFGHRDAQIKNMAVDTGDGSFRLIDLVSLTSVDATDETQADRWQHVVYDDLNTLVGSVRRNGYLTDDDPADARDVFRMALLDPHDSFIRHPANAHRVTPDSVAALDEISNEILETL